MTLYICICIAFHKTFDFAIVGVLISAVNKVLPDDTVQCFLIVLDGKTMKELARVEFEGIDRFPRDFHGIYTRDRQTSTAVWLLWKDDFEIIHISKDFESTVLIACESMKICWILFDCFISEDIRSKLVGLPWDKTLQYALRPFVHV